MFGHHPSGVKGRWYTGPLVTAGVWNTVEMRVSSVGPRQMRLSVECPSVRLEELKVCISIKSVLCVIFVHAMCTRTLSSSRMLSLNIELFALYIRLTASLANCVWRPSKPVLNSGSIRILQSGPRVYRLSWWPMR